MTASKSGDRSYKRSWKNLLINKSYQLRFTLFMVGLTSLLMVGLGIWVMWVANETTEVSMASVRGEACPRVPSIGDGLEDDEAPPAPSMKLDDGAAAAPKPAPADAAKDAAKPDEEPRAHARVQIDESSMTMMQTLPPEFVEQVVKHWTCELKQASKFHRLERGRLRILWAMIGTGIVLVLGLAGYGLKMTHRVAGPLFKVSLYLTKMRAGRFDKVYNLRKGDQLIDFYDHFKTAHGGIVTMQQDDIARISAVIAAADAAGEGNHPAVAELRELLARKEKSIE
ncbi:MAG TPA: hypothetical protein VFK02_15785 [Kofleriaceae bacterium]|nr:hypothetical protein [Kofleriaceae bacterium]